MTPNIMFELADRLKELREMRSLAEEEVKRISAEIDDTDYRLSNLMAETETQNFTRQGTMFCLTRTTRASAVAGNSDALFGALRKEGHGDIVKETVNANTLSAFVREQITEHNDALPAWLSGLVNVFEKTTVGVRKSSK